MSHPLLALLKQRHVAFVTGGAAVLAVVYLLLRTTSKKRPSPQRKHSPDGQQELGKAPSGLEALKASCDALEAELVTAREKHDEGKVERLRHILRHVYAALEQYEEMTPSPSQTATSSSSSKLRHKAKQLSRASSVKSAFSQSTETDDDDFEDALDDESILFVQPSQPTPAAFIPEGNTLAAVEGSGHVPAIDVEAREHDEIEQQADMTPSVDIYTEALTRVRLGEVKCRKERAALTGSAGLDDFLARLECVRDATTLIMKRQDVAMWFVSSGRELLTKILLKAGDDPIPFQSAFDEMIHYLSEHLSESSRDGIAAELARRRVVCLSFFDVIIDFVLLDAFDEVQV